MDSPNVHLHLPSSSTSSMSSTRSNQNKRFFSMSNARWQVGDKIIQQILSVIQPTIHSEYRRELIINILQAHVGDALGVKMFACGSGPLKTYLPDGDIDLVAISELDNSDDLATKFYTRLAYEEKNKTFLPVRNVTYVPAKVKVVKCTMGDIAVDISFNKKGGLNTLYFLEQVGELIKKDHLFKRSIILIKAWCYYESRLLGGFCGLLSTYALEIMVLHVINMFHSSLYSPLAVLRKFLDYYSKYNWDKYGIAANGHIIISSLPKIKVVQFHNQNNLLITEDFLRTSKAAILHSTEVVGTSNSAFDVKLLNILDPLMDDNNLGRCVSQGNSFRIKSALSYGTQQLRNVFTLPPAELGTELKRYFSNTIEINGKGKQTGDIFDGPGNYDMLYLPRPMTSTPYYMTESLPLSNDVPSWNPRGFPTVDSPTDSPTAFRQNVPSYVENQRTRGPFSPFGTTAGARPNSATMSIVEKVKPRGTTSPVNFNSRVLPVEPLPLTDDHEFPPLSTPKVPLVTLSAEEFPPLGPC